MTMIDFIWWMITIGMVFGAGMTCYKYLEGEIDFGAYLCLTGFFLIGVFVAGLGIVS